MLINPPSREYLRKDPLSLPNYYSDRFFQGVFLGKPLTDHMVLNEGTEFKPCTVSARNDSPFANIEARTPILEIQSFLHTVDPASDQLDNDAKVLGVAIWVRPFPRWVTYIAPSINLKEPNPNSQQTMNEMPQSRSQASSQIIAIFLIHEY